MQLLGILFHARFSSSQISYPDSICQTKGNDVDLVVDIVLTLIALLATVGATVWAVLVTRHSHTITPSTAALSVLGWILFIWSFPAMAYVSGNGADARVQVSVYIVAGSSALAGALLLAVRNVISTAPKHHREAPQYFIHWCGVFLLVTAGVLFAAQGLSMLWVALLAAFLGLVSVLGARILGNLPPR